MAQTRSQQRQTERQTSEQTTFLHDNENQSFRDGTMHINGRPQKPVRVEHWQSSNGLTNYTTVEWEDPVTGQKRTSCNCPGWTNKRRTDPHRRCKHTKDMEGEAVCDATKVDTVQITSADVAMQAIPEIVEGKELRGFIF